MFPLGERRLAAAFEVKAPHQSTEKGTRGRSFSSDMKCVALIGLQPLRKLFLFLSQQPAKHTHSAQSICTVGPTDDPANSSSRATTAFVTRYRLCAAGADSPCAATGFPVSPPNRIRGSISTSPSTGTPYSVAVFAPSPCPKISIGFPQCGQLNVLMFSTTPSTSTFTCRNISIALRTSASATVDGVVTTTAPVTATVWISVNCTSPVPGGKSITR